MTLSAETVKVRRQLTELQRKADVVENVLREVSREESRTALRNVLSMLQRDVERLGEMLDEHRALIQGMDR